MNRAPWLALFLLVILGVLAAVRWMPREGVHVAAPEGTRPDEPEVAAELEGIGEAPPPEGHDSAWRAPLAEGVPKSSTGTSSDRSRPGIFGHLEGLVVDEASGDPVPEFAIRISNSDRWEEVVVSDAQGRFTTRTELAAGTYSAFSLDHPDREDFRFKHRWAHIQGDDTQRIEFVPGAPPIVLEFQMGSAYRLDLVLPEGVEAIGLDAFLQSPGDRWTASTITRVRDGEHPWVRFRTPVPTNANAATWTRLRVASQDGTYVGEATVPVISTLEEGPFRVELRVTAALDLQIVQENGHPPPSYQVRLEDAFGQVHSPMSSGDLRDDGIDHRYRGVPSGQYRLLVDSPGFEPIDEWIDLVGPRIHHRVIRMHEPDGALDISGTFVTRSGRLRRDLGVRVVPVDGGLPRSAATARIEVDGVTVQGFQLGGLAPGRYRVIPAHSQLYRVTPPEIQVSESAADLSFTLEDEVPSASVKLEVVDQDSGDPLGSATFHLVYPGSAGREFQAHRGVVELHGLPEGAAFTWTLTGPGYRSILGTERDLATGVGPLTWELALQRGFGGLVRIVDGVGKPVAGRRVLGDGLSLGTTDAEGRLLISTERAPDALEVSGYRLPDGSVDIPSSRVQTQSPETVLRVVPRD